MMRLFVFILVSAMIEITTAWKMGVQSMIAINRLGRSLKLSAVVAKKEACDSSLGIRTSVSKIPPTRYLSPKKRNIIPINGQFIWDDLKKIQSGKVRRTFFLPHLRDKNDDVDLNVNYIHRVPTIIDLDSERKYIVVQDTNATIQSIDDFYRDALLQNENTKHTPSTHETTATLESGLRAIIVPYEHLEKVKPLFPNMKIRHFESSDDFYFQSMFASTPRINHDKVIDMCYDDELWFNRTTPVVTEPFTVDVIIHATHIYSLEGHVMERLAEH